MATLATHNDGGVPHENYAEQQIHQLSNIEQAWGDLKHRSLKDFLTRPVRVASGKWASTANSNTILETLKFPDVLLNRVMLANKLDGFTFLHASIRLEIEITAQPTQAGMALLHFIPNAKYSTAAATAINASITGKSGCPSQIINLASATAPVFKSVYLSNRYTYNLVTGDGTFGHFYFSVLSPLVSAAATDCNYFIWASFVDPIVSTPTAAKLVVPSLTAQCGNGIIPYSELCLDGDGDDRFRPSLNVMPELFAQVGGELMQREQSGVISSGLSAVSSIAASIPPSLGLSSITKPIEWVSSAAANVASLFGFSKPTSQVPCTTVKQKPNSFMFNSNGVDSSHKMALMADNELETDPALFANAIDEMTIASLVTRPAVLNSYDWKSTDLVGSSLFDVTVSPSDMYVISDSVNTLGTGNYAWLLSNMFNLWRGDIVYTFHFAKTKFHSGRLRISYYPYANADNSNLQNIDDMPTYAHTEVFDLSSADQFTFVVPYTSNTDWKYTSRAAGHNLYCTGKLILEVVNPLVAPNIVATSVKFWTQAHAAANMQFAIPINPRVYPQAFVPPPTPTPTLTSSAFASRSRRDVDEPPPRTNGTAEEELPELHAQVGSLNCFIGNKHLTLHTNDPARKSKKLKVKAPMADVEIATDIVNNEEEQPVELFAQIGSQITLPRSLAHKYEVEHMTTELSPQARCIGEVVPSLRPLLKRFIRVAEDAVINADSVLIFRPWAFSQHPNKPDNYALLKSCFQFYRGSMRLKIFVKRFSENFASQEAITVYTLNNTNIAAPVRYPNINQFYRVSADATDIAAYKKYGYAMPIILDKEGCIELDVPYHSLFHMCQAVETANIATSSGDGPMTAIVIEGLGECTVDIYRAPGDDFSFAAPMGIPILKVDTA